MTLDDAVTLTELETLTEPSTSTPLIIAAHGTRDPDGVAACRALAERVRRKLPGTRVELGYVELVEPGIDVAVQSVLDPSGGRAAVVPLMLAGGGHVRRDIPGAIGQASARTPGTQVTYARPIGDDPRLLRVLADRLAAAAGDWDLHDVSVVLLGRGSKVPEANADLARLARLLRESTGASVMPAYLQVTRPSLPEALGQTAAYGATRVVVVPHVLLPGLLRTWTTQQANAWAETNPDVLVRVAEIIGDCEELADIIVDRYREVADDCTPASDDGAPIYLSGLRLQGRDVLVVGAGQVADRRVPRLLQAGARVRIVSPTISVRLRRLLTAPTGQGAVGGESEEATGTLTWERKGFSESDVAGAWYILAATNDPAVNARVSAAAEAAHTFCVRADAATRGSAWTPAVETAGGLTVAVVGNRDSRRSVSVRDALLAALNG